MVSTGRCFLWTCGQSSRFCMCNRSMTKRLTRENCLSYVYTCIILFLSLFGKVKRKDRIGSVPCKVADYIHGGRVTALAMVALVSALPGEILRHYAPFPIVPRRRKESLTTLYSKPRVKPPARALAPCCSKKRRLLQIEATQRIGNKVKA